MTGKTLSFFSCTQNSGVNLCGVKTFLGRREGRKGGRKEEVPVKGGMSLDWYHIKKQLFRPINFINIFHDIVNFFLPQNFEGSDASAQLSKERIWKQRPTRLGKISWDSVPIYIPLSHSFHSSIESDACKPSWPTAINYVWVVKPRSLHSVQDLFVTQRRGPEMLGSELRYWK